MAKAQEMQAQAQAAAASAAAAGGAAGKAEPAKADAAADGDEDTEGVSPQHINMVMEHSNCSRAEAIKALKENNDDMVSAVMSLTK